MNEKAPANVNNAPATTIGDHSPQAHSTINDRTGMYLAIVAIVLSAIAIGMMVVMPQLNQARIDALRGELRAAQEEAKDAHTQCEVVKNRLMALDAELEARK